MKHIFNKIHVWKTWNLGYDSFSKTKTTRCPVQKIKYKLRANNYVSKRTHTAFLFAYLAFFRPLVVHSKTTSCFLAPLSSARTFTSGRCKCFSVMSRWNVRCRKSFGLATFLLPTCFHCIACLGYQCCGILIMFPYHLHILILSFLVLECCPVLCLRSTRWPCYTV